ncbi:MAG: hypothetical protein ACI4DK_15225 [Lachnospiraceae bacterium]
MKTVALMGGGLHGNFKKAIGNYSEYALSKGNMIFDIVALINSGVITTADLDGFSDELRESVDFLLHR